MKNYIGAKALLPALLLAGLWGANAQAAVWADSNQWNAAWEERYSEWVKDAFNEDIFTSGKYKGISTDCADAVYTSRAIFAFENHLPFVILDPTGGDGKISNRMSRFDGGSELSKFRNFIDYVNEMTDTKTLPRDTYPIAIQREYVRAGAIWSRPRIASKNFFSFLFGGNVKEDPGHAEVVKDVSDTGAIYLIGSTVPAAVRPLITTSSLVFMPIETSTGLRKWMEPDWYNAKKETLPGYSLEQFQLGDQVKSDPYGNGPDRHSRNIDGWTKDIQERLQTRAEGQEETLKRHAANLCNLVQARVDVIRKAEKARRALGEQCMNADAYDSYSTPSRDKRIMATIESMADLEGSFGFTISKRMKRVKKYMSDCPPVQITEERALSLADVAQAFADGHASSNPNDSLEARWGVGEGGRGSSCPTY